MRNRTADDEAVEIPTHIAVEALSRIDEDRRQRHEALAAIEREIAALYGARTRNLPTLIAKLRALL